MQTHRKGCVVLAGLITVVLFFVSWSPATAQQIFLKDRWGVGLRAGAAMLTQDVSNFLGRFDGDVGPIVSANIMYALEEMLLLGVNVEWESHNVNGVGLEFGKSTTISVIPTVEFRATEMNPFSPYLSLGMGININSLDLNDSFSSVFTKFDPPNTVALKAGIGADYFLTRNIALNAEAGWKYNSGKFNACLPGSICFRNDWKLSTASILLGLRYFF